MRWNNSKFADTVRGTPKKEFTTVEEFRDFIKEAKGKHPVRFWLAEHGIDLLQDIFSGPLELIRKMFKINSNSMVANNLRRFADTTLFAKTLHCNFDEFSRLLEKFFKNLGYDEVPEEYFFEDPLSDQKMREAIFLYEWWNKRATMSILINEETTMEEFTKRMETQKIEDQAMLENLVSLRPFFINIEFGDL